MCHTHHCWDWTCMLEGIKLAVLKTHWIHHLIRHSYHNNTNTPIQTALFPTVLHFFSQLIFHQCTLYTLAMMYWAKPHKQYSFCPQLCLGWYNPAPHACKTAVIMVAVDGSEDCLISCLVYNQDLANEVQRQLYAGGNWRAAYSIWRLRFRLQGVQGRWSVVKQMFSVQNTSL